LVEVDQCGIGISMSKGMEWQRSPDGFRFEQGGINTVLPPDQLPPSRYPYAQNIRWYQDKRVGSRSVEDDAVVTLPTNVHSIRRLNDSTPTGPATGFVLIEGAGGNLFAGFTMVNSGLSGNPLSLVPFRPNQSVQPWMYVADSNKMLKVRSDGLCYAMGIAEPQVAPSVHANVAATVISTIGDVTVYIFGDSPHSGPVGQYIWRNPSDTGSSGPERGIGQADVTVTGNSLIFDSAATGSPTVPMQWEILDAAGGSLGTKSLFEPALESEGYSDFNFVAQASLYVPAAGAYTFTIASKDSPIWGIGEGTGGTPTWTGKGTKRGQTNQTKTVIGGYDLLPVTYSNDGGGFTCTGSVSVTFPAAGVYPIELDYDYWYHSTRHCTIEVNGASIPPISSSIIVDAIYRYTYRSSATGATSNPSPSSIAISLPVSSTDLTAVPSVDPQVDKIDWYRQDAGLLEFTYVGTSPNSTVPFTDTLLDLEVAGNPLLQFDNFQPFPSIDLPKAGVVNIAAGSITGTLNVTWVSGNQFNTRWLPGTIMVIGTVAYTLYNRPTSATSVIVILPGDVPTALTNLPYEIAEPDLAAQPMPSMWGPTDNVNFMFACGDPLRPGVLYWTKGNNPDSAPDTNQEDVTSPSEPLINGAIVSGIAMVFSTERAWLIYPNFFNALATVTGVAGSQFSLVESIATRGLYIRNCICTDGGGNVFFRGKDGIYVSPGGTGAQSITDADLFNIFPHEGFKPVPITRAGYTIYPPDDTKPESQSLRSANGYVYYDYLDATSVPRTLVFDIQAKAWVVDVYGVPVTTHVLEEGPNVNGTLVGCTDGTVRPLVSGAEASSTTHVVPPLTGPMGATTQFQGGYYDESTRTLYWTEGHGTFGYINSYSPATGFAQVFTNDPFSVPWLPSRSSQSILVRNGVAYYFSLNQYGYGVMGPVDLTTGVTQYLVGGGPIFGPYGLVISMSVVTLSGIEYLVTSDSNNGVCFARLSDGYTGPSAANPIWTGTKTLGGIDNTIYTVGLGNRVVTDSDNNTWAVGIGHIARIVWDLVTKPVPTDYVVADVDPTYGAIYDPADRTIIYATSSGALVKWSIDTHTEVSRNSAAGVLSLSQLTADGLIVGGTTNPDHDLVRIYSASTLALVSEYSLSTLGLPAPVNGSLAFTPNTLIFGRFFDGVGPGIFVQDNNQQVWYVPIPIPPFSEDAQCVLLTQAVNAGDTRADKRIGDLFFRANVTPTNPVTIQPYSSQYVNLLTGFAPTSLASAVEQYKPFIVDFVSGESQEVDDIEMVFTWTVGETTYLSLWQPNWIPLPEGVQDRPTDFEDCGTPTAKFIQGFLLECDTFNTAKSFSVENADDGTLHIPNESPVTVDGQKIVAFTFTPPFVAHSVRLISTDGVQWRRWGLQWVFSLFPESVVEWQSESTSHGLLGWQHVRELNIAHISTADLTLTIIPDVGDPIVLTVPNSGGVQTKRKVTVPANKAKLYSYRLSSTEPFCVFAPDIETKVGMWGRTDSYTIVKPFGGPSEAKALI
jgi:hypothetical protein